MRSSSLSFLVALLMAGAPAAAVSQTAPPPPAANPIDAARVSDHIRILASDAFEGRGPGTAAEAKVIAYVINAYKAYGLEPAGDDGGWTQATPLRRFTLKGPIGLAFEHNGQRTPLTQGEDAVAMTEVPVSAVAIKDAPLVFVGYGVKAPERGWDDFKGVDLKGKVAVMLINDPDFEATPSDGAYGRFDGKSMTYYGRWTYKFEEAARQGALGVLIVHETAPAAYGWAIVKNSNTIPQFDIVRTEPFKTHPLVQGWIQRDVAKALFASAGLDFDALKKAARQTDFRPVVLKGVGFSADYGVQVDTIVSHNIVAKITGAVHPKETVLYSAHWDHLGIGPPDAKGDRIYNGALDNASGVAGMLEIARAFASGPRPQRTVAFIAMTAEEKGLLGSAYYADHPLFPLATTVADLNLDGVQVAGPAKDVSVQGDAKSTLQDLLAADAKAEGRYFSPDAHLEEGHFYRADHFSLAKVGVPAITLEGGEDLYQGGVAAGEAAHKDYTAHRYHQPADEWRADWDLRGAVLDLGLYYALGEQLANSRLWPSWKTGSEFKAVRDLTAAERAPPRAAAGF